MPLSGEDGKGNLSWHVFLSGEATYARTEGKQDVLQKWWYSDKLCFTSRKRSFHHEQYKSVQMASF
jgi:hypothetical protein